MARAGSPLHKLDTYSNKALRSYFKHVQSYNIEAKEKGIEDVASETQAYLEVILGEAKKRKIHLP